MGEGRSGSPSTMAGERELLAGSPERVRSTVESARLALRGWEDIWVFLRAVVAGSVSNIGYVLVDWQSAGRQGPRHGMDDRGVGGTYAAF